jgi:WD40 repeat protein
VAGCLFVFLVAMVPAGQETPQPVPEKKPKATVDTQNQPLPAGALARLGSTGLRHASDVTYVAFGADGETLLTAGEDNTIRLWDLATCKELRRFARPKPVPPKQLGKGDKPVAKEVDADQLMLMLGGGRSDGFRVALSTDGKTLAVANGNVIQFWEAETGKELRKVEGAPGGLAGLLFSPDGKTLAGRTFNGGLFLWAVNSGKVLHQIKPAQRRNRDGVLFLELGGGDTNAPGMAFTPDSKLLVAAATDYNKEQQPLLSVKFWDIATGKESRGFKAPDGINVSTVALSPDGKVLAYGGGGVVRLCEADSGKEIRQLKTGGGIRTLVFFPDGKVLVVRSRNQQVRFFSAQTGREIEQLSEAEPPPQTGGDFIFIANGFSGPESRTLAISQDGKQIASAAGSTVRIWETATGKERMLTEGHWRSPSAIKISNDGKTVVSWGYDRVIRRWEATTGKSLGSFPAPTGTTLAVFSSDGKTAALANADRTIRLHETASGKELSRIKAHPSGIAALGFAPGDKVLASRGSGDNTIRLHDVARGAELKQIVMSTPRRGGGDGNTIILIGGGGRGSRGTGPGLAFSPDGKLIVAPFSGRGDRSNRLVFFDTSTGKELRKIEAGQPILSFAFSPDGRTFASENSDRTITLWEVASGKERGHFGTAAAAQAAPNAGMMVLDLDVAIDGIGRGFTEPAGPVGITFSPDGRALAVRGPDRAIHFWDINAGKEMSQLKGHTGHVETLAFASNGKTLASGGTDTTILLWDATAPLKNISRQRPIQLSLTEVRGLWDDLAGEDATKAYQSIRRLASANGQALPFMGERVKPAARVDPEKINGWIADLESEKFAVRKDAAANLIKVGEQALPPLQKVLASGPALETRKRVEELVDRLTGGTLTTEQLRMVRAVEVLEQMATPEAHRLLQTLADGAPGALPTREAQAALNRLTRD